MMRKKAASGDPEVGARIRAIRQAKRWTLKELAGRSGFDQPNLSKVEHGQTGFSAESIRRIARALEVTVGDLFSSGAHGPVFWVPFMGEPERPMLATSRQVSDAAFALEVAEDALTPLIHRGDIVVCEPKLSWSMGRPVIARYGEELIVRKVRTLVPAKLSKTRIKPNGQGKEWDIIGDPLYELYTDNNLVPRVKAKAGTACYILGPVVQRISDVLRIPMPIGTQES